MWEIIVALVAFAVSICALVAPVIKLNITIAELNTTVKLLRGDMATNEDANKKAHKDFYKRFDNLEKDTTEIKTKMKIYHKH